MKMLPACFLLALSLASAQADGYTRNDVTNEVGRATGAQLVGCSSRTEDVFSNCLLLPGNGQRFQQAIESYYATALKGDWRVSEAGSSNEIVAGSRKIGLAISEVAGVTTLKITDLNLQKGIQREASASYYSKQADQAGATPNAGYIRANDLWTFGTVARKGEQVEVAIGRTSLRFIPGSRKAFLNGASGTLSATPFAMDSMTLLPLRAVAAFGCSYASINPEDFEVSITCGAKSTKVWYEAFRTQNPPAGEMKF